MTALLVVDDDDDLCTMVALVLEMHGHVVDTAANGLEALACVERRMPDLILLDMKMPVMSGPEFLAAYRDRYSEAERAPVIAMTATDHATRRSQEVGADDFLAKPFSTDELVRAVDKNLGSPGSAS